MFIKIVVYNFLKLLFISFLVFLISKTFFLKIVRADYMRGIEVCVNASNLDGVVQLTDTKGATRYVRIGKAQYSSNPPVRDYYNADGVRKNNCSYFQGWGLCMRVREFHDQQQDSSWLDNPTAMDYLCNNGETFPVVGYKKYASSCAMDHWGCKQDPISISVHIPNCSCSSSSWESGNNGCAYINSFNITCTCSNPPKSCGEWNCSSSGCTGGLTCHNNQCCRNCGSGQWSCGSGCLCNQGPTMGLGFCQNCYAPDVSCNIKFEDSSGNTDINRVGIRLDLKDISGTRRAIKTYCGQPQRVTQYQGNLNQVSDPSTCIQSSDISSYLFFWPPPLVYEDPNRIAIPPVMLGSNLDQGSIRISQVEIFGYARDSVGNTAGWSSLKTLYKKAAIDSFRWRTEPLILGETNTLHWITRYAKECKLFLFGSCYTTSGCISCGAGCCVVNCAGGGAGLNVSFSNSGTCTAIFQALNNGCDDSRTLNRDISPPSSWLMTEYGDSFANQGYSNMELRETSGNLAVAYPPPNYFSRYIISARNTTLTAGRESRRGYKLVSYSDQNVNKRPFYEYLEDLVTSSITSLNPSTGWSDTGDGVFKYTGVSNTLNIVGRSCNRRAVIFVEGNLNITPPFPIIGVDHGCLFVVQGDITISNTGTVAGYFITDKNFTTRGNGTLIIKGGVITNTGTFDCDVANNPGEIIEYDPRYLNIMKSYLGELYPFKIREYKYSTP